MIVRLSIAAFLAAVALPTLPDDELLPELTPKGQYLVLTEDDAASSSKCIGEPVTPMCAVETVLACFVRASKNLCLIGMDEAMMTEYGFGKPGPMIYRVVRREVLTDRRFPWNPDLLPDHADAPAGPRLLTIAPVAFRHDVNSNAVGSSSL